MDEKKIVTTPLVRVGVAPDDRDPSYTRIYYFVGDTLIMDMSVEASYVRPDGPLPLMVLTQLLVTPHQHLNLLAEHLAIGRHIKPEGLPSEISMEKYQVLLDRTDQLLSPPPLPEDKTD